VPHSDRDDLDHRAVTPGLWADALLCKAFKRAGRWTAVVVDRFDGEEHPMPAVRFRYRSHAVEVCDYYRGVWDRRGVTVAMEPRPIERGAWAVVIVGQESGQVTSLGEILTFTDQLEALDWVDTRNRAATAASPLSSGLTRYELRRIE
jgi:hypothetical protein